MKKYIAVLMVFVMVCSLCACGNKTDDIQDALQGTWEASWIAFGKNISREYVFKGNTYTTSGVSIDGAIDPETGTIEIEESVIHTIPDDGSDGKDLEYSYNEKTGTITLWWSDEIELEKR